jgi:16S rRNA (uracil1498-N3)-methyltransferase
LRDRPPSKRVPRIYTPQPLAVGTILRLEDASAHHLRQVLRLGKGSSLVVFNGDGREAGARIRAFSSRDPEVEVLDLWEPQPAPPLHLTLAQSISKGDRMDYTLQKAVELGVSELVPLFTQCCVVRLQGERLQRRMTHWERVVIGACEQSGRSHLATIRPAVDLETWLSENPAPGILLHPDAALTMRDLQPPRERLSLLVGPEGGLSATETEQAIVAGLTPVRLGPRVLRTETAPLAALAAIQTLWGDF